MRTFYIILFSLTMAMSSQALANPGHMISPMQAKQIAMERFGGKALSAELVSAGGESAYRVKLIKAGRVKIVTIPANP